MEELVRGNGSPRYSHQPAGYVCPFCRLRAGVEADGEWLCRGDVVYRDERVLAFVSPEWWPRNPGHVLIVPAEHIENLYQLPTAVAGRIHEVTRWLALAMKSAYRCDGTSTRQHNEPAGDQEVWHYHLHLFPRHPGDELYRSDKALVPRAERSVYARRLREAIAELLDPTVPTSVRLRVAR